MKEHIRNMLTLRYDPLEKPFLTPTKYKDWIPCIYETTGISLERKLMVSLQKLEPYDKIGIALSSGIDSVLLLRLIYHMYPEKKVYAFHWKGMHGEEEDARIYAEAFGAEFVLIETESILKTLQWQVSLMQEPMWDAWDYLIYQMASHMGCQVVVDGSGADELFGGYTFRYNNYNPTGEGTEAKFYAYMDVHSHDWVDDQAHMFGPEIPFEWEMIKENVIENFGNPLNTISQIFMADYNGKLSHLFAKKQAKFQYVYNTPILSPYLDKYVIEYGTKLEPSLKIMGSVGKVPLRQIAARYDLAVTPNKYGFSHNTVDEWNRPDVHDEAVEDITCPDNQMFSQGLISYDWVKRHVNSEKDSQDVRYVNKFYHLMALEQYLRQRMQMDYV
jgi:asparagine synthase (glutamine-hydrolysing)